MIKILTGWSHPGGSTTAHINLCKLFNANGMDCCLYGPHEWHKQFNFGRSLLEANIHPEDHVIAHFLDIPYIQCKTLTYSCHETNIKPIRSLSYTRYHIIHYVSQRQKEWHQIDYPSVVIPNVLDILIPNPKKEPVIAGVIGSIDYHKQTHISIQRALDSGYKTIVLCGIMTDPYYWMEYIEPLVKKHPGTIYNVGYRENKQLMYDNIHEVFHSSKRETFNLVKAECQLTNTKYNGLESAESGAEIWDNQKILSAWKEIFNGKV